MSKNINLETMIKLYILNRDPDINYTHKDFAKIYKKAQSTISICMSLIEELREKTDINLLLMSCRTEIDKQIKDGIIKKKHNYRTPSKYVLDKRITKIFPANLPRLYKSIYNDNQRMAIYILNKDPDFCLTYDEIAKLFNIHYNTCNDYIRSVELLRRTKDIRGNLIDARNQINKMIENGEIKLKKEFKTPIYNILYGNEENIIFKD